MDVPSQSQVIASIEAFLARHDMAPTRFGREATGEPQLLQSLREGRSPSLKVLASVSAYMRAKDGETAHAAEVMQITEVPPSGSAVEFAGERVA